MQDRTDTAGQADGFYGYAVRVRDTQITAAEKAVAEAQKRLDKLLKERRMLQERALRPVRTDSTPYGDTQHG
jgi:3-hydroxyacyl-CoA dehydrogenase